MSIFLTIVFIVAVVVLMVAITYFLYYYNLQFMCNADPNYWCFNDWQCSAETDPAKAFPAKSLYCHTGDINFCNDPANSNLPACICNLGKGDGCLPPVCSCQWATGASSLGTCGNKYCSSGSVVGCQAPPS